jgi:hypothetical protein
MKGMYRLDVPDTVFASTPWAIVYLYGAANMAPAVCELEIVSYNPFDAVRLGLTALPNANAGVSGGLPTIDAALNVSTLQVDSGTAQAGGTNTITLRSGASATDSLFNGAVVTIYGGTGAGQSRVITGYVGSTKVATVGRNWVIQPDSTSVYKIHGLAVPRVDDNLAVIVQAGAGTGQLDFTSGVVKANATQWASGAIPAPNVTGVPLVDVKYSLGTLSAGAAGYFAPDWGHVNAPTTVLNLSGTNVAGVNSLASGTDSVNTVATSGSTLTTGTTISGSYASTAQLDGTYWQIADSAGTLDMYFEFNVGTLGVPTSAFWNGGLTTAVDSLKVYAYNWAGSSWDQVGTVAGTSSLISAAQEFNFTTAHVGTGGNLGLVRLRFQNTGLVSANFYTDRVLCAYTNVYVFPTNFSSLSIDGSGRVDLGKWIGSAPAALDGTYVKVDVEDWKAATAPAMTGDAFARLGAPAGASVSADIAEIAAETDNIAAVKTQTDKLVFTVANQIDANPLSINGDATAAANLAKTTRAIGRGTVTTGGSTTSVPTSAFAPAGAIADQFKGRVVLFDANTTTATLRGVASAISASSNAANPTFTVGALPATPASGDLFSVL